MVEGECFMVVKIFVGVIMARLKISLDGIVKSPEVVQLMLGIL